MNKFKSILYVTTGLRDEQPALMQALSLARQNAASLKLLVLCPRLPDNLAGYAHQYETGLREQVEANVQKALSGLHASTAPLNYHVEVEAGADPVAVRAIKAVLKHGHDLLIKEAEPMGDRTGFKALDMDLLRKCPVPVWLCRPIMAHSADIKVAVAVDANREEQAAHEMAHALIQLADQLAISGSGKLDVLSCWEYKYEEYLRGNSWVSESELQREMDRTEQDHAAALKQLVQESGVGQAELTQVRLQGRPYLAIPDYVQQNGIDILVMGTVARTGVPGFVIGNTAENILQAVSCSLLVMKPAGFVCPVTV